MEYYQLDINKIAGPFFTAEQAAEYCGYRRSTFRDLLKEYDIPKHGPRRTKYARTVLDAFMVAPEMFLRLGQVRTRKPQPVKV